MAPFSIGLNSGQSDVTNSDRSTHRTDRGGAFGCRTRTIVTSGCREHNDYATGIVSNIFFNAAAAKFYSGNFSECK